MIRKHGVDPLPEPLSGERVSYSTISPLRHRVSKRFSSPSMTKQSFKDETDINVIVSRALKNGFLPPLPSNPVFADVSREFDYRDSLDRIASIQDAFDTLPAEVRARFSNDPANLLDALVDESRVDELVDLGILNRPAADPASRIAGDPSEGPLPDVHITPAAKVSKKSSKASGSDLGDVTGDISEN